MACFISIFMSLTFYWEYCNISTSNEEFLFGRGSSYRYFYLMYSYVTTHIDFKWIPFPSCIVNFLLLVPEVCVCASLVLRLLTWYHRTNSAVLSLCHVGGKYIERVRICILYPYSSLLPVPVLPDSRHSRQYE
jgi:hypothetical protein